MPTATAGVGPALDPRWKLATAAVAIGAALALRGLPITLLGLLATAVYVLAAGVKPRWYRARAGGTLLAMTLFALPLPFLLDGPGPVWELGGVRISAHGLVVGAQLTAKALTVVTVTLALLATTPGVALLKAAHVLGVPGFVVQIAALTYRYLFVLAEELQRLRIAVRVRGFRNRASRHAYRTVGRVAGALLVRGHERAERVYHAMRCRGFDGRYRALTPFGTRRADVAVFLLVAVIAGGLVLLDRFHF